jgi:hypothetical protein
MLGTVQRVRMWACRACRALSVHVCGGMCCSQPIPQLVMTWVPVQPDNSVPLYTGLCRRALSVSSGGTWPGD